MHLSLLAHTFLGNAPNDETSGEQQWIDGQGSGRQAASRKIGTAGDAKDGKRKNYAVLWTFRVLPCNGETQAVGMLDAECMTLELRVMQANLSGEIEPTPASSMFLVPSPSPAENFDDGSMEEPERPEIKGNPPKDPAPFLQEPISTGLPTKRSDVNGEHEMDRKPVLPLRPEAPLCSTAADKEVIYAKKEITNAPLTPDPDLYAPLF
ncbi:putative glycosyltransferase [Panicum miliaceum]|uniref:Glycosyltransferase n=1 Tax=Panicum miliaceum TaxID=4540 RepID=A0A3L6SSA2_PANMI|nr:putative glycosyltransferase [Panicum miliaceum]